MDEKTEELIALVAKNHGVSLDKDDPIMIVQTMIRYVMNESRELQRETLEELKSELQGVFMQWEYNAKEKADRILNAALQANTEAMQRVLEASARETASLMRKEVEDSLRKSEAQYKRVRGLAYLNIAAAFLSVLAACVAGLSLWFTS